MFPVKRNNHSSQTLKLLKKNPSAITFYLPGGQIFSTEFGLGKRGDPKALNDTKLIINGWRGHSCSSRTNLVSFRTFRRPLFPKPVSWLAVSYSKTALERITFDGGNSSIPIVVVFISIHPIMRNVNGKSTLALYLSPFLSWRKMNSRTFYFQASSTMRYRRWVGSYSNAYPTGAVIKNDTPETVIFANLAYSTNFNLKFHYFIYSSLELKKWSWEWREIWSVAAPIAGCSAELGHSAGSPKKKSANSVSFRKGKGKGAKQALTSRSHCA